MSSSDSDLLLGGVELGGTTIKVAVSRGAVTNVIHQHSFETGACPKTAVKTALEFFKQPQYKEKVKAIGIASFGPVDLDQKSKTYGYITSTPKPGWTDADVLGPFKELGIPVGFNTDVNAAAIGELKHGKHGDISSCVYVTVGTGIGAGIVTDGKCLSGILHPEAGHIPVRRHPDDTFAGKCPFHKDCLEGLATANNLAARLGIDIHDLPSLPDDHQVWDFEAYYLGQFCATLAMITSPHVIILGGGVLKRTSLFPKIRKVFVETINNYLRVSKMIDTPEKYIVPSLFEAADSHTSSGGVGALELAYQALQQSQ